MYNFFNDFFDDFSLFPQFEQTNSTQYQPCKQCGYTYSQFKNTGKLGCGECYNTFYQYLEPALKEIHFNTRHVGKIPSRGGDDLKKARELKLLKNQLNEAVRVENYEDAAKLHKQIRQLESEGKL